MKITSIISFILVIVGALNWLLVGLFNLDLVALVFGPMSFLSRTIYSLVGLAGLWMIFFVFAFKPFKAIKN
ncbi:MAG: DUF378 domain-containing protein [Clostridia bacterium]|nr:DUF378 domain-containing protein [Clostridia bacterium]